jgi:hypothetical protein
VTGAGLEADAPGDADVPGEGEVPDEVDVPDDVDPPPGPLGDVPAFGVIVT